MIIKLKDFRETIGAPPFCKHAGSCLLPNVPNTPNCGLVLKLARYRVSRAVEASLHQVIMFNLPTFSFISYSVPQSWCKADIQATDKTRPTASENRCKLYPPERKLTKAIQTSLNLEGEAQSEI